MGKPSITIGVKYDGRQAIGSGTKSVCLMGWNDENISGRDRLNTVWCLDPTAAANQDANAVARVSMKNLIDMGRQIHRVEAWITQ